MDCPVCKNTMITLELQGVEIDYCPACGGIWLDGGELEILLNNHAKAKTLLESFTHEPASAETHRKCPICLKKLLKINVGSEQPPLLIDMCKKGHGLWFDKGELNNILNRARLDKDNKIQELLQNMFNAPTMTIQKKTFGKMPDGREVELFTLANTAGIKVEIITYGGIIRVLQTPDRHGFPPDIVLGYDTLEEYFNNTAYFGAAIGRYANRIAKGQFTLDGIQYQLATNNGPNHLHGGVKGFNSVLWHAEPSKTPDAVSLKLSYLSKDGQEYYPGDLSCTVTYTLTAQNELHIAYEAQTDKPTIINLTNHSYFNLAGHDSSTILNHQLMLNADKYLVVDNDLIPTGEIHHVRGSCMDFLKPRIIGQEIWRTRGGYDHAYVLNNSAGNLALAARLHDPSTGRTMEIATTEPCIQLYTGNFLNPSYKGKGAVYDKHSALCLETQHYPDSPNHPDFPSTVLRPGQTYSQLTVHKFYAEQSQINNNL